MHYTVHAASFQGRRPEQSDRYAVVHLEDGLLVEVMDGVGSGRGGDEAAQVVMQVAQGLSRKQARTPDVLLRELVSESLYRLHGTLGATTLTAAHVGSQGHMHLIQVGDSAAFHLGRAGGVEHLTPLHRLNRHFLTRALHGEPQAAWRASTEHEALVGPDMQDGDVLLLATDGYYESLNSEQLNEHLHRYALEPTPFEVHRLASLALATSTDNVTALFVCAKESKT